MSKKKMTLKTKIKGNTMMEVLIAMLIMSVSVALASNIYINIQKSNQSFFKLKALELSEQAFIKFSQHPSTAEESYQVEEFVVKKILTPHPLLIDCWVMRIMVFDSRQKKILEQEKVIHQINSYEIDGDN